MTRTSELLEALCGLFDVCDKTAQALEENCPALAEVGYWNSRDKAAYERAKAIVEAFRKPRELPDAGILRRTDK